MRVGVVGATGFVGRALCAALGARGDQVVAFSRDPARARATLGGVADARPLTPLTPAAVEDLGAVVNLAGEPVAARRWDAAFKAAIRESRVQTTRRVVDAIGGAEPRPRVLVNASATGFYGPRGDEVVTEATPAGGDFLAGVCSDWEAEAERVARFGVREVRLRIGIVLGGEGSPLAKMQVPFRLFVGGPVGDGRQWLPWVHLDDVVGAILRALDRESLRGPVNLVAPEPARSRDFAAALGRRLRRPSWITVPTFALRLAVGEMAEVIAAGQRVSPSALLADGYPFRYPTLESALAATLPHA